jgi:hypothetical protein
MSEVQTFNGLIHRSRRFWSFAEFAFDSISSAVMNKKEIHFGTAMGGPEKCLGRPNHLQSLFDRKAFP